MKKLFAVMLLIVACIFVTSCAKEETPTSVAPGAEAETITAESAATEEPQQSEAYTLSHEEAIESGYYSNFEI